MSTVSDYVDEAQQFASAVPEDIDVDEVEWLPLGVFAVTNQDDDVSNLEDATLFMQLAITKDGIIAGSLQNTATDNAVELEGTVDTESQRAAWGPVGGSWPIMETGIYNLTENESGALVHFEDGQTQQWKMIRLDEPQEENAVQGPPAP